MELWNCGTFAMGRWLRCRFLWLSLPQPCTQRPQCSTVMARISLPYARPAAMLHTLRRGRQQATCHSSLASSLGALLLDTSWVLECTAATTTADWDLSCVQHRGQTAPFPPSTPTPAPAPQATGISVRLCSACGALGSVTVSTPSLVEALIWSGETLSGRRRRWKKLRLE